MMSIRIRQHRQRNSFKNTMVLAAISFSTFVQPHSFTPLSSSQLHIPKNLILKNVILFTRHGDRSQISRSIGTNFPENDQITNIWKGKLPTEEITSKLLKVATYHKEDDHNELYGKRLT